MRDISTQSLDKAALSSLVMYPSFMQAQSLNELHLQNLSKCTGTDGTLCCSDVQILPQYCSYLILTTAMSGHGKRSPC